MKKNFVAVAVMVAASVALVGCGGGGPSGAVKGWFNAMNEGKHSAALEYLSGGLKELSKMDGGKAMSDDMTNAGTMSKLEIVEENVRGEGAEVKARVHFKDGSVEDQNISLIKEDGKWKITL